MDAVLHILAEPLASDNLWLVLVFIAVLAVMTRLRAMETHITERRRGRPRRVVR